MDSEDKLSLITVALCGLALTGCQLFGLEEPDPESLRDTKIHLAGCALAKQGVKGLGEVLGVAVAMGMDQEKAKALMGGYEDCADGEESQ